MLCISQHFWFAFNHLVRRSQRQGLEQVNNNVLVVSHCLNPALYRLLSFTTSRLGHCALIVLPTSDDTFPITFTPSCVSDSRNMVSFDFFGFLEISSIVLRYSHCL